MTYQAAENSSAAGRPVELFEFGLGARQWRYTSAQIAQTHVGHHYAPVSIQRSALEQGAELQRLTLTVTIARDDDVAAQWRAAPPDGVMSLTIYRRHLSDPTAETIVAWKGRVTGCRFMGGCAELSCEPVATSLKRPGLRARYSLLCRHPLYSAGCGVAKESFAAVGAVGAVSGVTVTIEAAGGQPSGFFVAGMLKTADGAARMIVAHTGNTITLTAPFPGLSAGMTVTLYAGCDHSLAHCRDRFGNLANFGGFPFIPGKNPFAGDAIV